MDLTTPLIGREHEFGILNDLRGRDRASLVLIYGRRRVGKTTLIQRWAAQTGLPTFYWESPRSTADNVRASLAREFSRWQSGSLGAFAPRFDNWMDLFRAMRQSIGNQESILIFDEFPWAVEADDALPSHLKTAWDQLFYASRAHIFITGSHISAMEKLLESDAPLFGRMTRKLYVRPLQYTQIEPFTLRYDAEKRLAVHSIIGGIPDYLKAWDDRKDLLWNIKYFFVAEDSPYRTERHLLISDVLRRNSPDYEAVIDAIGRGHHDADAIGTDAMIPSHRVAYVLSGLVETRLVERRVRASIPVRQHNNARHGRYFLSDPFLRFYHRFIVPNRSLIAQGMLAPLEQEFRDGLRAYVGAAFEDLCREWTLEQARRSALPFPVDYVGSDWGPRHQADVVAVGWRARSVLIGEAKWTDHDFTSSEWTEFQTRVSHVLERLQLADSGKSAVTDWRVQRVLFVRRGIARSVRAAVADSGTTVVPFDRIVADLKNPQPAG